MTSKAKVVGAVALAAIGLAVVVAIRTGQSPAPTAGDPVAEADLYVGNEACARCHSGEAFRHARSGHAHTLTSTIDSHVARELDGKTFHDPERGVDFHYRSTDRGLVVTIPEKHGDEEFPLSWAMGSGEHAVTFLTLVPTFDGETVGLEHRVSIFGPDRRLALTPSHAGNMATQGIEDFGRIKEPPGLKACLDCHTTTYRIVRDTLANLRANVGCEKCHGPGARHVRLMESRPTAGSLEDLAILRGRGRLSAREEIAACGECHRHPATLTDSKSKINPNNKKLARYQPVGLTQSACFVKSGETLRCTTCHDPHENASRELDRFEGHCIQCHPSDRTRSPPCPVSPREKCIACHMPLVEVRPGTSFHDHWIRVREDQPKTLDPGEAVHPLPNDKPTP